MNKSSVRGNLQHLHIFSKERVRCVSLSLTREAANKVHLPNFKTVYKLVYETAFSLAMSARKWFLSKDSK